MSVNLVGNEIQIRFPYNPEILDLVRSQLPDRAWKATDKLWTVPATPFHARKVLDVLGNHLQVPEPVKRLAVRDQRDYNHSTLDLSIGNLQPRPYQAGAVEFLNAAGGRGIIGDDVGLGKTCESLSYARFKGLAPVLIVCPASVIYKWQKEVGMWYPEMADATVVLADSQVTLSGRVHIVSYDMMVRRQLELQRQHYKLIIFDEVHRIKNYKTLRYKAAKYLSQGVPYILGLSGTPILNRPKELYNILSLLDSRAWGWYQFFNRYCGGKEEGYDGAHHLDELEERLRSVMIRRFKHDVIEQLPPFVRTVVPVKLNDQAMRTYTQLVNRSPRTIREVFPESKGYFANELDWLGAMRQYLERARSLHVAEWAEDFLDAGSGKLVIYCGFHSTVDSLAERLERYGVARITGKISNAERQQVIERWQTTTRERVMLLTSAGGEGIDLFGKNGIDCSTILFAGREWSPAIEEQIEGRLDRYGQTFPVEAVYLVVQDTLDTDIDTLIADKRAVIRGALGLSDTVTTIVPDLVSLLTKRGLISKPEK